MKTIKEVSELTGISVRTLQYYDKLKILPVRRNQLNYRVYGEEELKKLWEICLLKNMGMSLTQIKQYLTDKTSNLIKNHKLVLMDRLMNVIKQLILLEGYDKGHDLLNQVPSISFNENIEKIIDELIKEIKV